MPDLFHILYHTGTLCKYRNCLSDDTTSFHGCFYIHWQLSLGRVCVLTLFPMSWWTYILILSLVWDSDVVSLACFNYFYWIFGDNCQKLTLFLPKTEVAFTRLAPNFVGVFIGVLSDRKCIFFCFFVFFGVSGVDKRVKRQNFVRFLSVEWVCLTRIAKIIPKSVFPGPT